MKRLIIPVVVVLTIAAYFWWQSSPNQGNGFSMPPPVVSVSVAETATISDRVEALGSAEAWQSTEVTAKNSGKVAAVNFDDNARVKAGDVLVELAADSERAALREAEVVLAEDRRVLDEYQRLIETGAISKTQLEVQRAKVAASEQSAAAARAELAEYRITAPFSGYLGKRMVSVGALVSPGTIITTLDNLDPLKIHFTLPERWFGKVAVGQTMTAHSTIYNDEAFPVDIVGVGPRLDPDTRSLSILGRLTNPELKLRPGMLLTIEVTSNERDALMVSEEAVLQEGAAKYVYRVDGDNRVARVEVITGARRDGRVEVLKGLAVGDRLVAAGTQKVRDGVTVKVVDSGEGQQS